MLKDTIRTESYQKFITSNSALFKGATVLDIGCGTGILSMFAAQAGAKKVFAVDASKVAFKAMRNVKENGWSEIVEVIHGKIEDLDEGKIIISEWMGYFLL
jgi:FkbM family methyltransferase